MCTWFNYSPPSTNKPIEIKEKEEAETLILRKHSKKNQIEHWTYISLRILIEIPTDPNFCERLNVVGWIERQKEKKTLWEKKTIQIKRAIRPMDAYVQRWLKCIWRCWMNMSNPFFPFGIIKLPVENGIRTIQRVIFQDRIWHALLHLITINVILPPHTNVSMLLLFLSHSFFRASLYYTVTFYDCVQCIGPCNRTGTHYILFNFTEDFIPNGFFSVGCCWFLLMVFKVMAIRATVSVWKKNGKRIKLQRTFDSFSVSFFVARSKAGWICVQWIYILIIVFVCQFISSNSSSLTKLSINMHPNIDLFVIKIWNKCWFFMLHFNIINMLSVNYEK